MPPSHTPGLEFMPRPWTIMELAKTNSVESTYIKRTTVEKSVDVWVGSGAALTPDG